MSKIPKDPKEILQEITDDYKGLFEEELVTIILYGSAAGPDYRPGKSDINLMIVLTQNGIERLDQALKSVEKWRKRNVAVPLFMTEGYVRTSVDVFPIEYLNLRGSHVLVYGKNILTDLVFNPAYLRLQCEREIKGKLLLLRSAFLESGARSQALTGVIRKSIEAFVAIFRALLHLKEVEPPVEKREIIREACRVFSLDVPLFETLLDVKEDRRRPKKDEIRSLFLGYLREIQKLSVATDSFGG